MAPSAQSPRLPRLLGLALAAAVVGALSAAQPASADLFRPQGDSPGARDIQFLYDMILAVAVVVFIAVEGLLLWSLWKFRAKKGAVAAQIHGNTRLEIGWTIGAALILVVLTIVTFIKMPAIINPPPSDIDAQGNPVASNVEVAAIDQPAPAVGSEVLNIKVDGQQYVWRFQYPGPLDVFSYDEMVVPIGMTVTLDISADDVMHSWWIPALGGKADAVPGYVNQMWFKATERATYPGQCAELCGRNHANMLARVRAVPFDEYEEWYEQQAAAIEEAQRLAPLQRQDLEGQGEDDLAPGLEPPGVADPQPNEQP